MSKALIRSAGLRLERVRASERFVDGVFRNTADVSSGLKKGTAFGVFGEFLSGNNATKPPAPLPSENPLEIWAHAPETGLRATWLGHSTVLVEIDGARVLTDPVWSDRASPFTFAGPKRFQPVPVAIAHLPKLNAVIVSHDHYDHLDAHTIAQLAHIDVPFFTSLGVGAHLERMGVPAERITELDWWETAVVPNTGVTITAAPSQHFSGRGLKRNETLWSSFAMRGPKHRAFFSGDTGLTQEYAEIKTRLGPFDLVMLEAGAFHEAWGDIHLGPENALTALELLGGGTLLPVHWGTFNLALHSWDDPAETLVKLADTKRHHLVMPKLGAATEPARAEKIDPWWRQLNHRALS